MPLLYTKIKPRIFHIKNLDSMWDFYVIFVRKICVLSTCVLCTSLRKIETQKM